MILCKKKPDELTFSGLNLGKEEIEKRLNFAASEVLKRTPHIKGTFKLGSMISLKTFREDKTYSKKDGSERSYIKVEAGNEYNVFEYYLNGYEYKLQTRFDSTGKILGTYSGLFEVNINDIVDAGYVLVRLSESNLPIRILYVEVPYVATPETLAMSKGAYKLVEFHEIENSGEYLARMNLVCYE